MNKNAVPPLTEQLQQALQTFNAASEAAEVAAAAFVEIKRLVGSNDEDRKTARANTPAANW